MRVPPWRTGPSRQVRGGVRARTATPSPSSPWTPCPPPPPPPPHQSHPMRWKLHHLLLLLPVCRWLSSKLTLIILWQRDLVNRHPGLDQMAQGSYDPKEASPSARFRCKQDKTKLAFNCFSILSSWGWGCDVSGQEHRLLRIRYKRVVEVGI